MLQLKKGENILFELGGIKTRQQMTALFKARLDKENCEKLKGIENQMARLKIANAIALMDPAYVFINSGSEQDLATIRRRSIEGAEERPLAIDGHTIHYDLPQEQARIVDRTYYIVNEGSDVSIMANKMLREEAHEYIKQHMSGIAKGMTLYVGFYSRGPIGAHAALPAIEITTSSYVMHSADILYRNVYEQFDDEVARSGYAFANLHSQGPNRPQDLPNARVFSVLAARVHDERRSREVVSGKSA